jgi:uncharacterized protein (TIGR00369 family)
MNEESITFGVLPKEVARSISGLEMLEGMMAGKYPAPPIAEGFNYRLTEVALGRIVFTAKPTIKHYNPLGVVHGGYITTLLDSAMACAILTTHQPGQASTTIELKVNFVRPVSDQTGEIYAEGKTINVGRQIATADGKLLDSNGKLLAHATTTCLIFAI